MQSIAPLLAGIALGIGLFGPIGPLNLYLIRQGLTRGWRQSVPSVVLIGINNTVMILVAAIVAVTATDRMESLRLPLTIGGALYLTILAITSARTSQRTSITSDAAHVSLRRTVLMCMVLVWLNPHAILDAFGVLGNAISAQPASSRTAFSAGVILSAWIWYVALASSASAFRDRMTERSLAWLNRGSAAILAAFAAMFWFHALTW